jgi:hypothetical protein
MPAQIGGSATITGVITDPSGAVIAGAKVKATSLKTGVALERISDKDGLYSLSPLDPGDYAIAVTVPGFDTIKRPHIHVDGMDVLGLDLTMKVGAADTTVTVTDIPPALETENATLGAAMENDVYQSLPLEMGAAGSPDQRRATDFAALMPGVTANITKNNETDEPLVVNGNQNSSEMYMEGIPATSVSVAGDPRYIWSAFSVETVDQFQLKTSAYSAEYRGLGVENFTIKSGGNGIHGSIYGVFRNTAFDAIGFLPPVDAAATLTSQASGGGTVYKNSPLPEHQAEYGMTLSGPIIKNKLFFFGSYMGFRYSTQTLPTYETVPTARMMTGDFTELLANGTASATASPNGLAASASKAIQVYDPITQTCTAGNASCTRTQAGAGSSNWNVIPATEISPISQAFLNSGMNQLPLRSGTITNNYLGSYPWGLSNWSQMERFDYNPNDHHRISVIYGEGRQGLIGSAGGGTTNTAPLPYMYSKVYAPITKDFIGEHTWMINNSVVNQLKYTAMQYYSPAYNPTLVNPSWAASQYGIKGLPVGQAANSFPTFKFGSSGIAQWGPQASAGNVTNNFTLLDNVAVLIGKHSLSFGGQYQWLEYNNNADATGTSPLTLNYAYTETTNFSKATTANTAEGWDFASFMYGAVDSGTYTQYAAIVKSTGARFHPLAVFFNDDYKVTSKLTINAGLRWDFIPPFHEAENRFSFMNPNLTNPYTGTAGALQFAGFGANSCACKTPINNYFANWGPRLGFAYAVNNKTVIRASAGMYYSLGGGTGGNSVSTSLGSNNLLQGFSAAPNPPSPGDALPAFYLNGNSNLSADAGHTVGNSYSNDPTNTYFGSSSYSVTAPPIYDSGYGTYYSTASALTTSADYISTTMAYLDPKNGGRAPEFTGWTLGFERQITRDLTVSASYVGNEGHHVLASGTKNGYYANQLNPAYLTLQGCLADTATSAYLSSCGLTLPYSSFPSSQKFSQMLLPFPQYKGVSNLVDAVSNSNYNSLQITASQRLAHGLTVMFNYTFSKSIDDAGTYRSGYALPSTVTDNGKAYGLGKLDRSLSTFDQRQAINSTWTYDLPFGKGHIGGGNQIVSALSGGWRLSGIFTYIGGNPLSLTAASCGNVSGQGTCMPVKNPNFTGSVRQNGKWGQGATRNNLSTLQYINPNAYVDVAQLNGSSTDYAGNTLPNVNGGYVIGTVARTAPDGLRGPSNYNIDGSIRRTFNVWNKENVKFVFEANVFNAVNHVWFGSTSSNTNGGSIGQSVPKSYTSSTLGVVTGQANNPRQWQFAGHINF